MNSERKTLESVYVSYLKNHRNKYTRAAYEATMRPLMKAIGGDRRLTSITTLDLLDFTGDLKRPERKLAPASVNKHIKHIKAFFNWCVRIEELAKSPASAVSYVRVPKRRQRRMIDDEQQKLLLTYTQFFPQKDAIVRFLIDTGCRRKEAAELQIRNLDLRQWEVIVVGKGDKMRIAWFGLECAKVIQRHLSNRLLNHAGSTAPESYVFSRDGEAMTPASLGQLFRRTCVAAGIGSYGPHQLRAKKITKLLRARVNPESVREVVGHENVETTLTYVDPDTREARAIAREFAVGGAVDKRKILRLPTGSD